MSKFVNGVNTSLKGLAVNCFMKLVVACLIAVILQVSFTVIATGTSTKDIGYQVLYSEDGKQYDEVYTHYYENGEDTKIAQYEKDEHYYKVTVRSTLSDSIMSNIGLVSTAIALIILFASVYSTVWAAGDAIANKEEYEGKRPDPFFGIKIGLAAQIPQAVLYVVLVIARFFDTTKYIGTAFKISTYYMYWYNDLFLTVENKVMNVSYLGLLAELAVFLPLPLFCGIAYILGNKRVMLKKLMYKKGE